MGKNDTQHNDALLNDTQHNNKNNATLSKNDTEHINTVTTLSADCLYAECQLNLNCYAECRSA
jgi:hypothetical protein